MSLYANSTRVLPLYVRVFASMVVEGLHMCCVDIVFFFNARQLAGTPPESVVNNDQLFARMLSPMFFLLFLLCPIDFSPFLQTHIHIKNPDSHIHTSSFHHPGRVSFPRCEKYKRRFVAVRGMAHLVGSICARATVQLSR